jgi:hypothetical protein
MAISKNKTQIIDDIILKDLKDFKQYEWWFDDSDDDYYDYIYGNGSYNDNYSYLYDNDYVPARVKYIHRLFGRITTSESYVQLKKIKMTSVYSKQYLRQLKLEAILEGKNLPDDKNYLIYNLSEKSLKKLKNKII